MHVEYRTEPTVVLVLIVFIDEVLLPPVAAKTL